MKAKTNKTNMRTLYQILRDTMYKLLSLMIKYIAKSKQSMWKMKLMQIERKKNEGGGKGKSEREKKARKLRLKIQQIKLWHGRY